MNICLYDHETKPHKNPILCNSTIIIKQIKVGLDDSIDDIRKVFHLKFDLVF